MKLYHYVHCPFCIRVRMGLGLLNLHYQSIVVSYDDENLPISLTGVKMLPIFQNTDGLSQNESLEILKNLDALNFLQWDYLKQFQAEIEDLINQIGKPVHSLCMPYWIWTPEFNNESRTYFQMKKELKRGPFKKLIQDKKIYLDQLQQILDFRIEKNLTPFYKSSSLTIVDIMIASHLWGMYIFPEFQFSEKIHNYLQKIKEKCHFDYHHDFWN